MINLKILRNIINNNPLKKEKPISEKILSNKNNIFYPDSDLVNVIDTPYIILNDKNNISFINNATKKKFNINIAIIFFTSLEDQNFVKILKNLERVGLSNISLLLNYSQFLKQAFLILKFINFKIIIFFYLLSILLVCIN